MTVIKKYNDGTSAWETIVVGKQGATGPEGPAGDPGSALIDAKGDLLAGTAADTLAALAVGTNDHVLTADSGEATGMKWAAAAGGGGKVLQVVSAVTSTSTTVSGATFTDTTLTATITPSAATSKILVLVSQPGEVKRNDSVVYSAHRLLRGATTIYNTGGTFFANSLGAVATGATRVDAINVLAMSFLDSPNTTSATTYKTQGRGETANDTIIFQRFSSEASIVLMEIGV